MKSLIALALLSITNLDYFASNLRMTQQMLHGQDNHATVVAFEGELNREHFIKSLQMVFEAHPNLRIKKIAYDPQEKRFYPDGELPFSELSHTFIEVDDEEDWRQIISQELSHPFSPDGPYWRTCCLTLKHNPARHYFIQFFDHSLSDGISTAQLNAEFFQALTHQKKIEAPKDSPATSEQSCNWEEYKKRQDHLSQLYPMPSQGAPYEKSVPLQQRRTQAVLFAFKLDPLPQASKAHDLTINDLLVAASLSALQKSQLNPDLPFDTSVLTCVNLRNPKLGGKADAHHLACRFNIVVTPQKIEPLSPLWTIAENYHKLSSLFIQQLARPPPDFSIEEICERNGINIAPKRNHFAGGLATSNLGKIALKRKYGDIDILFYQFFTNQGAGFFEVLLDACCLEDTIYCNLTYAEPLHSRPWALQFASHLIHALNSALQNQLTLIESATDKDLFIKEGS